MLLFSSTDYGVGGGVFDSVFMETLLDIVDRTEASVYESPQEQTEVPEIREVG